MALTVEGIVRAKPKKSGDRWLSDKSKQRGSGRLVLRVSPNGSKQFYFRYTTEAGRRDSIPLLPFTAEPRDGFMTLAQARGKADQYTALHRNKESRDVRSYLAQQERAQRESEAAEAARIERERADAEAQRVYTLRALAAEYVATLQKEGKHRSANDVRSILKNHMNGNVVADRPAKDVERGEITALLRKVVDAGKGRTAGKLRSYLHAAYAMALHADGDASASGAFEEFKVTTNPVAGTKALSKFTKARDRTLGVAELHAYWTRLTNVPSEPMRGALQLALLLGGQRVAQLLRLRRADVDLSEGRLTLLDPKGRRTQPRKHDLPVTPAAMNILRPLVERAATLGCDYVFTSDGKAPIDGGTLTHVVRDIAATMVKAGESPDAFKLADIRRTAETMLARAGVPSDVRAHIQSHGLSGVQHRHYDKHDYWDEKRRALTSWANKVRAKPAQVVPLHRRA